MLAHYADMRRRQSIAAAGAAPGIIPGTPITAPSTPAAIASVPTADTAALETKGKAAAKTAKKEKAAGGGAASRKRANAADAAAGEANTGPAKKKPRKAPAKKGKDKDKVDAGRRYTPQDVTATLLDLHKTLMAHDRSAQLFNVPVDTVLYNIPVWL